MRKAGLLLLLLWLSPAVVASAQDVERQIQQQVSFMPAFRECGPAEVQGFGLGVQPANALLSQLYVRSRSDKVITTVRLRWKVYEWKQGGSIAARPCEVDIPPLQAGQSDLINVEGLRTTETIIIGTNPLPVSDSGKRTVFVAKPLLTADDLKDVFVRGLHPRYMVILYLAEVRYQDGKSWVMPSPVSMENG